VFKSLQLLIYILMVLVGLVAMYTLLNAGNPESLLRPYLPNPVHDVYLAVASSVFVFILGFFVFFFRDVEGFRQLLEMNRKKIIAMLEKGSSREEIADSILDSMGSRKGYRHNLARKKLLIQLAAFK
jgi:predicted membrane channel-forming protein YqfA (hemolysin III family)